MGWEFPTYEFVREYKFSAGQTQILFPYPKKQKKDFINKEMFKKHWAYKYIVPIYNIPELESVLEMAKIPFTKTGNKIKKYIKLFPTDPRYEKTDEIQIKELLNTLKKQNNTNLNKFLDFCLNSSN